MPGLEIGRFVRTHGPAVLFVAALAAGARLHAPPAPERSLDGLATLLGGAAAVEVLPDAIRWEPAPPFVLEALWGRTVLFLGSETPGGRRDLYRARVRVTLGGQPIEVTQTRNLSQTPLGDEAALDVAGDSAVVATTAFGKIQGITVIDLRGARAEDFVGGWDERLLGRVSAYLDTGSWSGLGRTDLVFGAPGAAARLRLEPPKLRIDFGNPERDVVYDIESRVTSSDGDAGAFGARVVPRQQGGERPAAWLVDALESALGAVRMGRLQRAVLSVRDRLRRLGFALSPGGGAEWVDAAVQSPDRERSGVGAWPPPTIPSRWSEPEPGEGQWVPVTLPWLARPRGTTAEPPPYFFTTFVRPDPERPYSRVHLVAMDMRQLELRMEAGFDRPEATTGPPGAGRLPADRDALDRVVATFNGGGREDGGMMVRGRVLVPPVGGAASVVVSREGDAGFGPWPEDASLRREIVSFRQSFGPFGEIGSSSSAEQSISGWDIGGGDVVGERTALCLTRSQQVVYAWAPEIGARRLAEALEHAGCTFGAHLAFGPDPCGLSFVKVGDAGGAGMKAELLNDDMSLRPERHALGSSSDFFYLSVRDTSRLQTGKLEFSPSKTRQPTPGWLPALYRAKRRLGQLEVTVLAFEKGRFDWIIRAGSGEPPAVGMRPKKTGLEPGELQRATAAVNLGHTTDATRYGLAFEGDPSLALRRSYATLVLREGRSPRIVAPGKRPELEEDEDAVQLPMLADDGDLLPTARDHGAMRRRGALCVTPQGRTLVAFAHHDSDHPVVKTLVEAGCVRVVGLDRGSKHPAFAHLPGTQNPPRAGYETTVLYALGRPMIPGAFRWHPK